MKVQQLTDGVLDTNAKAKSDAKFTEINWNTELDKLLDKAISLGRANKPVLPTQVQALARVKQAQVQAQKAMKQYDLSKQHLRHQLEIQMVVCLCDGVNLQRSASRIL